ncbi:hypothetical protein [Streptomyces sp. NPDC089915]|uniref:hypothetical protein n=1 Tax=Streptomyces sp. NPDC089915 TaxID=3155186 RepID=UPI00342F8CEF
MEQSSAAESSSPSVVTGCSKNCGLVHAPLGTYAVTSVPWTYAESGPDASHDPGGTTEEAGFPQTR